VFKSFRKTKKGFVKGQNVSRGNFTTPNDYDNDQAHDHGEPAMMATIRITTPT